MKPVLFAAAVSLPCLFAGVAAAAEYEVQMLNKDSEGRVMQFEPAFLKIEPGDTVKFIATDKGHNSQSIEDAIPEGAEPWKGKINEEISITLNEEGLYAYKCLPHFALGMVGLIQVGDDTSNREAIEAATYPGKADERMAELLEEMDKESAEATEGDKTAQ